MQIWNYHSETKELLAKSLAVESPLEPGVFLIPAHATNIEPPKAKKGYAIVFNNESWEYVKDHRGETWWDESGKEVIIDEIGPDIVKNLSAEQPLPPSISEQTAS